MSFRQPGVMICSAEEVALWPIWQKGLKAHCDTFVTSLQLHNNLAAAVQGKGLVIILPETRREH